MKPIVWLLLALALWVAWLLSGIPRRRRRRERARLLARAQRESSPLRRRALLLQAHELGSPRSDARELERQAVRQQGQQARSAGLPLSTNPYGRGLWGKARTWKEGWLSVERQIRWIEKHR